MFKAKEAEKDVTIDLDAIIEDTQYVRFQGMVHEIKPILVEEFFALAVAMAKLNEIKTAAVVTTDEVVSAYHAFIGPACPTITKEMILKASHAQIYALIEFIVGHIKGRAHEKKKNLVPMELSRVERLG
jgi:hypothetical protein